jgi:MtrB/PioB family decaheme-associated outer membrane protein
MKTSNKSLGLGRTLIAAALVTATGTAYAQDDDLAKLTQLESSVGVGVAGVTGDEHDRTIFGQYNGLRKDSGYLLLDFDFIKRDDKTGTWTNIMGRNLGLDSRELGISMNRQGDWKVALDYSELVHHEIRTINTGEVGIGSTAVTITRLGGSLPGGAGTGSDVDLEMKRKKLGVDLDKWINSAFQVQFSFKNEDKDGSRTWGRGYECAARGGALPDVCNRALNATNVRWAVLWLPEPVNSNTKQIEAKLNYSTKNLFLTGGYYGSFYTNSNGSLQTTVNTPLNGASGQLQPVNGVGPVSIFNSMPMALAPDNQAHQFYIAGNYAFTPTTRSNFKLAYTHATQNENFGGMGLADGTQPRDDLGGVLDTTLAQVGLTAHPMPKLSLLADFRYEDKKDKTPIAVYNLETSGGVAETWTNTPTSLKRSKAKLEGSYLFPAQVRGTLGFDYEKIDRALPLPGVQVAGFSGLRGQTEEMGVRAELRRSISDTVIGAVSVAHSEREGSDWFSLSAATYGQLLSNSAVYNATGAFPYMLADRKRDKVRLSADWSASDRLSMNFAVEGDNDDYNPPSTAGLQESKMALFSIDASYVLSDRWKLTGYLSQSEQKLKTGQSSAYRADLKDTNTAVGLGITGTPMSRLEVGGKVSYINDVTKYPLSPYPDAPNATAVAQYGAYGGLPEVTYRQTQLNLYGKYALEKNADLRLDVVYFQAKLEEYAWTNNGIPFTYQDNTTVGIDPNQSVTYVGVTYIYKMK